MSCICFGRRRTAFTLIEVLVVVAIIALLAAILLPSLRAARDQAKVVQCLANLGTLGKACMAYINSERDRFCFGTVGYDSSGPYPILASWYFGGNRGQDSGKLGSGPPGSGYVEGSLGDWGPAERPLNRYVYPGKLGLDQRPLRQPGPLRVYECPADSGGRWNGVPSEKLQEATTCYLETGSSYGENTNWWAYVDNEMKVDSTINRRARLLHLMDRFVPIMRKKGASRAILLYEDPADWSLSTGLMTFGGFPKGFRVMGWHNKYDVHSLLFLDGHAASLYVDWSKNLPDPPTKLVSGTSTWVSHQEVGDR